MADELPTGVCSGNWWSTTSQSGFNGSSSVSSEMKSRSGEESASVSGNSSHFHDTQKAHATYSLGNSSGLMDTTVQMGGFGHPLPSTIDWGQALFSRSSARGESSFHAMLQDDLNSRVNYCDETGIEQRLSSGDGAATTSQGLPLNSFSLGPSSYRCPSMVLQGLTEPNPQPDQSLYDSKSMNYPSSTNYHVNSNEFPSSWPKFPQFLKNSPPKQQHPDQLHFKNSTPFWNASVEPMNDFRSNFYPSQNQFLAPILDEKPNCSGFVSKNMEEVRNSGSTSKKSTTEPTYKRPRNETPSPLPTFKVRKEKLGDRITVLQQLVSPFGKTDTASVLFDTIEYIKFLHDQVSVLSAPYMKNAVHTQRPQDLRYREQNSDKLKEAEGSKQDLRSHGLCLVPISSIFPVTNETTTDFWTPKFGGTFR